MNILPFFKLICKFCADSQNQDSPVGWDVDRCTLRIPDSARCGVSLISGLRLNLARAIFSREMQAQQFPVENSGPEIFPMMLVVCTVYSYTL